MFIEAFLAEPIFTTSKNMDPEKPIFTTKKMDPENGQRRKPVYMTEPFSLGLSDRTSAFEIETLTCKKYLNLRFTKRLRAKFS